jgi:hypothetical protein
VEIIFQTEIDKYNNKQIILQLAYFIRQTDDRQTEDERKVMAKVHHANMI